MAHEDPNREAGPGAGAEGPQGQADDTPDEQVAPDLIDWPRQSPLFHAEQEPRYERQRLIMAYEERFGCRLVVMVDRVAPESVTFFEELIYDADPNEDLHLLLSTPGGSGEAALRLVRAAQARCVELTVIIPDIAKSAGTLIALGAHHILMGPTSDLGPVDPQFFRGSEIVSAKDLIAAWESANAAIQEAPETYPLHISLMADVTAVQIEQARAALAYTDELVEDVLKSQPDRTADEVRVLMGTLKEPLIDAPKQHGAVINAADALSYGLPVVQADPALEQWRIIRLLFSRYFLMNDGWTGIYEGRRASRVISWRPPQ